MICFIYGSVEYSIASRLSIFVVPFPRFKFSFATSPPAFKYNKSKKPHSTQSFSLSGDCHEKK